MSVRILILSKRLYMGKDLLGDRYGRFRELPVELARLGHDVRGICLSYKQKPEGKEIDEAVEWDSFNIGGTVLPGLVRYWRASLAITRQFEPEVIIGASDAFHAIWSVMLARKTGAKAIVDLYDNFETYRGTRLPFVYGAFRKAVRQADLVSCVSTPLIELTRKRYNRTGPTILLENGVRPDLFHPMDKVAARRMLGLPEEALLVGTAGALFRNRDIETAFKAADILAKGGNKAQLVVAGPREEGLAWPTAMPVHDLGMLPHDAIPQLLNALDVVIVSNADTGFGNFCHPQKLVEANACQRPVAVANVGNLQHLLDGTGQSHYEVGNPESLARCLSLQLVQPKYAGPACGWQELGSRLSGQLERL